MPTAGTPVKGGLKFCGRTPISVVERAFSDGSGAVALQEPPWRAPVRPISGWRLRKQTPAVEAQAHCICAIKRRNERAVTFENMYPQRLSALLEYLTLEMLAYGRQKPAFSHFVTRIFNKILAEQLAHFIR